MEPRILPPTLYFTRELLVIATDQASTYRDFLLVLLVLLAVGCLSALTIAAPARLDWRVARLGGMWCAPGCASQGLHKANASGRPQSAEAARSGLLSREAVAQSVAQWEVVRVRWHVPASVENGAVSSQHTVRILASRRRPVQLPLGHRLAAAALVRLACTATQT